MKEVDDAIQSVKYDVRTMKEYMTYEMRLLETRMEGIERGRAECLIKESEMRAISMAEKCSKRVNL